MSVHEIYRQIARHFGYECSEAFIEYLKVLFTAEEGELLFQFTEPASCEEVAKRLNRDEQDLSTKLEELRRRRLLFKGTKGYLFHIGIHGFFARIAAAKEEDIPTGFYEAWNSFMPEVERRMIDLNIRLDRQFEGVRRERILPARLAISVSPNVREEDLLWYEDVHEMLRRKGEEGVIAVFDCPCRRRAHNCERPLWNCFEFGQYAEFNLSQDSRLKVISVEEAIAISDEAERAGLLPSGVGNFATGFGNVLCHCCQCCCNVMGAFIRSGTAHELFSPSRFRAKVQEELCTGCKACASRCFFGAIQMRQSAGSGKFKASINEERCMGCGLCVLGCKVGAMELELVRPPEHIPVEQLAPRVTLPGMEYREILQGM